MGFRLQFVLGFNFDDKLYSIEKGLASTYDQTAKKFPSSCTGINRFIAIFRKFHTHFVIKVAFNLIPVKISKRKTVLLRCFSVHFLM